MTGELGQEESEPEVISGGTGNGMSAGVVASAVISAFLLLILVGIILGFIYVYGRHNPGGIAERIALRLEANYKRFGGDLTGDDLNGPSSAEMARPKNKDNLKAVNNNNNSITVSF